MSMMNNWTSLSFAVESVDPNYFWLPKTYTVDNLLIWICFWLLTRRSRTGMGMKQQKTMTRMLKMITVTHKNTFCLQWNPPPPTRAAPVATYVTGFHSAAHAVSPPRVHRPPDPSGPMTLPVVPASRRQWRHRITAITSRVRRSGETVSSSRRLTHCVWRVSCLFDCFLWVVCLIGACEFLVWLLLVSCVFDCRFWISLI